MSTNQRNEYWYYNRAIMILKRYKICSKYLFLLNKSNLQIERDCFYHF